MNYRYSKKLVKIRAGRRLPLFAALLLLCFAVPGCTAGDETSSDDMPETVGEAVEISDSGLEEAIRAALEKPEGELTVEDLAGLEELRATRREIAVLDGLEHAANLLSLDLYRNEIDDLSPIGGLVRLEVLILSDNELRDISPLGGLVNLRELKLTENRIRDLAAVEWENLAALETLDLRYNYLRLSDSGVMALIDSLIENGVEVLYEPMY